MISGYETPVGEGRCDVDNSILIVEDHDAVRLSLRDWLSTSFPNCRFNEARSGEEALALARQKPPDIVLMDIWLPQMNGIEATKRIKSLMPQTQVVMLTMYEAPDYVSSATDAGAAAYVLKRKMHTDLIPTVRALLSRTKA